MAFSTIFIIADTDDASVHVTLTDGTRIITLFCMRVMGCCVVVVQTQIQQGTRPPIQETSVPDPYQHLRHFPPDLVEQWIQIRTGNMLQIQEMGQPGPYQDLRQRVPTHMMYGLLQRERGNDEFVRLSRTVIPA